MKKVILSVAAVFAFGFANAQETVSEGFSKGDVFINGAIGFGTSKAGDNKTTGFEVAPSVGYFVTENVAVGVRLGFASDKTEDVGVDNKVTTYSVGAFGRYYFTPASKFSLFGELGVMYDNSKVEQGALESKTNGLGVQVAPGVSYFIANNFALEATFGVLSYNNVDPDGGEKRNSFNLGLDTRDIRLGLVYKF